MPAAPGAAMYRRIDREAVNRLRAALSGEVFTPKDGGYDDACKGWNLAIEQHPAIVAIVESSGDAAEVVRFAGGQSLGIGVQGTGHGLTVAADGGVLVNTSRMKGVVIDPVARTARVRAGAQWKDVLPLAHHFGLAALCGSSPEVGVLGYTLGGGTGWLARCYGHAADSVLAAEVVTSGGEVLRVSPTEHPDLFYALRGGGGNFGIVTELTFQLYPVSHVYGGGLFYPIGEARAVLSCYREWVKTLPDRMTSRVAMLHVPDRSVVAMQSCLVGTEDEGRALLAPFRDALPPAMDTYRVMPFDAIGTIANDPVDPVATVRGCELLDGLSTETIDRLVSVAGVRGSLLIGAEVRHLGGALASNRNSLVGNAKAEFCMIALARVPGPGQQGMAERAVVLAREAVQPSALGCALLNAMDGADTRSVGAAYSEANYARLAAAKRRYDPDNRFRYNLNIAP